MSVRHLCDGDGCDQEGTHLCAPRAQRVVDVFQTVLVHTKTRQWARKAFLLRPWQLDIIVPLFGWVEFSEHWQSWVRVYRVLWIELARKNGKSELLAGIALVLLVADDEEGAEVYGAAKDKDQARIVYDVAERMVQLSPILSKRIRINQQQKRLVDRKTASFYQAIPADAAGNLGGNPHGIIFDEVIAQPDRLLWDVLRTGMGAREQPLMVAATTAGDDLTAFAYQEHEYSERVAKDPQLDPRRMVVIRNTPMDADPFDESNWSHANPALDDFLSRETLRDEALEAKNDPAKEHSFRQFRLNQWQQKATRWMLDFVWDACAGDLAESPAELDGRAARQRCFGGLDLSATVDLTSLCWVFPDLNNFALWRFWIPEDTVTLLDRLLGGVFRPWAAQGWVTITPGATIDYDSVYAQIDADRQAFRVVDLNYDRWMAAPVVQELEKRSLTSVQITQGFALSEPIKEVMRLVKSGNLRHGGNPVARWNVLSTEVKQDSRERYELIKPVRGRSAARIDGTAALVFAIDGVMRRGNVPERKRRAIGW